VASFCLFQLCRQICSLCVPCLALLFFILLLGAFFPLVCFFWFNPFSELGWCQFFFCFLISSRVAAKVVEPDFNRHSLVAYTDAALWIGTYGSFSSGLSFSF